VFSSDGSSVFSAPAVFSEDGALVPLESSFEGSSAVISSVVPSAGGEPSDGSADDELWVAVGTGDSDGVVALLDACVVELDESGVVSRDAVLDVSCSGVDVFALSDCELEQA